MDAASHRYVYVGNPWNATTAVSLEFAAIGLPGGGNWGIRDLWARAEAGTQAGTLQWTLQPHDSALLLIHPPK